MKNILLNIVVFAALIMLGNTNIVAQSFELVKPEVLPQVVSGVKDEFEISSAPELKNISTSSVNCIMTITPVSLAEGHNYYYCDLENCLPGPFTGVRISNPFILEPGTSTGSLLHVYLMPNSNDGSSVFNISFENVNNSEDKISYQVTFNIGPLGVVEQIITLNGSAITPNPAIDFVNIDLEKINSDKIMIYDLNAVVIKELDVQNSEHVININTTNFLNGIYFFNVISDNKIIKKGSFCIAK